MGVGAFGRNHLRVLRQIPGAELTAIVDTDPSRAASAATEFGIPALSLSELPGKIDAAVVAVPTSSHAEVGCTLLDAGIDVLIEKPIAGDLPSARRLVESAERNGRILQVGHLERYNLAVGVYAGFVETFNRVKAIPRTTAEVDFVAMAKSANAGSPQEAVDYFSRRFLSVELQPERRAAIVAFLHSEVNSDILDYNDKNLGTALRRTVHLILSAPEYQLG